MSMNQQLSTNKQQWHLNKWKAELQGEKVKRIKLKTLSGKATKYLKKLCVSKVYSITFMELCIEVCCLPSAYRDNVICQAIDMIY